VDSASAVVPTVVALAATAALRRASNAMLLPRVLPRSLSAHRNACHAQHPIVSHRRRNALECYELLWAG